jgi:hypothetical protein
MLCLLTLSKTDGTSRGELSLALNRLLHFLRQFIAESEELNSSDLLSLRSHADFFLLLLLALDVVCDLPNFGCDLKDVFSDVLARFDPRAAGADLSCMGLEESSSPSSTVCFDRGRLSLSCAATAFIDSPTYSSSFCFASSSACINSVSECWPVWSVAWDSSSAAAVLLALILAFRDCRAFRSLLLVRGAFGTPSWLLARGFLPPRLALLTLSVSFLSYVYSEVFTRRRGCLSLLASSEDCCCSLLRDERLLLRLATSFSDAAVASEGLTVPIRARSALSSWNKRTSSSESYTFFIVGRRCESQQFSINRPTALGKVGGISGRASFKMTFSKCSDRVISSKGR